MKPADFCSSAKSRSSDSELKPLPPDLLSPSFGESSAWVRTMQSALDMFLRRFITVGRLTMRWPDGSTQIYEGRPGPEAGVILRDRRTVWRLMLNPKLAVGKPIWTAAWSPSAARSTTSSM